MNPIVVQKIAKKVIWRKNLAEEKRRDWALMNNCSVSVS